MAVLKVGKNRVKFSTFERDVKDWAWEATIGNVVVATSKPPYESQKLAAEAAKEFVRNVRGE